MNHLKSENSISRSAMLPGEISWETWSCLYTDTARWDPVIREICRREGIPVERITAGFPGTNAVFLLDARLVIKIAPPQCHQDQRNELDIGRTLSGRIPVPRILASGIFPDRVDWPWFLMEYRPGKALRELRGCLSRKNWLDICKQTGGIVRVIHDTPLQDLTMIDTSSATWDAYVALRRQEAIASFAESKTLDASLLSEATRFLDGFPVQDQPLVLVNADLTEDHLLLVEENGTWTISALIDLADGLVAPAAYEWPALWFGLLGRDREGLDAFLHAYHPGWKSDDSFRRKLIGYTLLHRFGRNMLSDALERMGHPKTGSWAELSNLLFWPEAT